MADLKKINEADAPPPYDFKEIPITTKQERLNKRVVDKMKHIVASLAGSFSSKTSYEMFTDLETPEFLTLLKKELKIREFTCVDAIQPCSHNKCPGCVSQKESCPCRRSGVLLLGNCPRCHEYLKPVVFCPHAINKHGYGDCCRPKLIITD